MTDGFSWPIVPLVGSSVVSLHDDPNYQRQTGVINCFFLTIVFLLHFWFIVEHSSHLDHLLENSIERGDGSDSGKPRTNLAIGQTSGVSSEVFQASSIPTTRNYPWLACFDCSLLQAKFLHSIVQLQPFLISLLLVLFLLLEGEVR